MIFHCYVSFPEGTWLVVSLTCCWASNPWDPATTFPQGGRWAPRLGHYFGGALTFLVGGFNPHKNISLLGWSFSIDGKIRNVPNHQPGSHRCGKTQGSLRKFIRKWWMFDIYAITGGYHNAPIVPQQWLESTVNGSEQPLRNGDLDLEQVAPTENQDHHVSTKQGKWRKNKCCG